MKIMSHAGRDHATGDQIYGWTADGNSLIYYRIAPIRWYLFDLRTGKEQEMISHPKLVIHNAEPSPDLKWVAFMLQGVVNSPVKIAPLRDGRAAGESEWITVAAYPGRNVRPWWSPDGNLLYFLSLKDNYFDIWAQRLHAVTKRPVGEASTGCGLALPGSYSAPAARRGETSSLFLGETSLADR